MTNNEVGRDVYDLAQRIGATSQNPEIWGDKVVMHFPDRKNFPIKEDVVRYCEEKGYGIQTGCIIQTLDHEKYGTEGRQEKCFYGYIRVPVGWEEVSIPEPVTSSPSIIERLLRVGRLVRVFRRTRNSPAPNVIRKPVESKIYCRPSTMSFDEMHIVKLTPTLEELSRILYSGINKED